MQNCSLHPESVKLSTTGLPDWIEANFIPQFLDIGQEERANSTLWLRVPENNTSGTNDNNLYQFNMIADVILLGNSITQSNASLSFIANRPPFANAGSSETVYEGTLIKLDGRKSYDLDSDSLSYLWEQLPGNLYVNLSNNAISDPTFISPKVSNDSKLSFRLTVFDERGAESNSVVNFVIRDLNHVPQVTNQIINTTEDLSASINLNANDSDPEDKLSYNLSSLPLHGKLSGITPNLVYTPDKNYNGKDSFKYRVNDGVKSSIEDGTVTIVVTIGKRSTAGKFRYNYHG